MAELRAIGVQFREAIDYLKGKLPEASLRWNDLAGPVHSKVFAVAGATSADLLHDLHQAVTDSLANSGTLGTFRKDFDAIVAKHGWTYRGSRGWRSAVIFDTNMRSAQMAGRWEQVIAQERLGTKMYGEYRTAGDARVRPQHRAWNGLTYPSGDPFWRTHYPPNGWGCRCTVRWYTRREFDRKKLQVSEPYKVTYRNVTTRDGEITDRVPVGIDPGWDHNVGQSWIRPELALGHKLARLPSPLRGPVTDKAVSPQFQEVLADRWKAHRTAVQAGEKQATDAQVLGFLDSGMLDGLAAKVPELQLKSSAIASFDIPAGASWPEKWVDDLPKTLRDYRAVLWDTQDQRLVVIPSGSFNERTPVISLAPNATTQFGATFALKGLGTASTSALRSDRFRVISGRLD